MRERALTLVFALGALALFAVMFLKREGAFGGNEVPAPISSEGRGGGYHAAMAWLEGEGIRTFSLRERFNALQGRDDLPKRGNLLIVTLPTRAAFRTDEFAPLARWLRAGNTLLVMAAISDNPDWAAFRGAYAAGDINLLTGLEFETVPMREQRLAQRSRRVTSNEPRRPRARSAASGVPEATEPDAFRAFSEPVRTVLVPNRSHAYFDGVQELVALSDYQRASWAVKVPYQGFVLALAHDRDSGEGAIWTRPLGNGRIIVSGYGSLFTNRAIGLADNARLLANIVGTNVTSVAGADPGEQGAVLFDDLHQGLGANYDPDKFYKDPRLYISIAILAAVWFVWVLGGTRLRLPVVRHPMPREAELIRAAGGFLSRALTNSAGAQQLLSNFFRRVRMSSGAPAEGPTPWDLLERNARITQDDLQQIRRWHADAQSGRRVPLRALHNLIVRLDRQMAT
jgi:hypothetical protein